MVMMKEAFQAYQETHQQGSGLFSYRCTPKNVTVLTDDMRILETFYFKCQRQIL